VRILLLAPHPFFEDRGTPIADKALIESLLSAGHEVDVLTYHLGQDPEIEDLEIFRIPSLPGIRRMHPGFSWQKLVCDVFFFSKLISHMRTNEYDVLHAVEESSFLALAVQRFFGVPFIYDMDSSLPEQMIEKFPWLMHFRETMEKLERRAVEGSSGVVAVCRRLQQRVVDLDSSKPVALVEDFTLLRNGAPVVDVSDSFLGIGRPRAMYVGNLEFYQGIDLLIDSFELIQARGEEVFLVVIGGQPPAVEAYRRLVISKGLEEKVFFLGPRPLQELGSYLQEADVLVSPRIKGSNTPMKIYSYLDSGKPLVATRLLTHTQVLDDSIAYLVDPEPEQMAGALTRLCRDQAMARQLAEQARMRVDREYTNVAFRRKLNAFYQEMESRLLDKMEVCSG